MTSKSKVHIKRFIAVHPVLRGLYGAALVLRWRKEFERVGFVESQLRGEPTDRSGLPLPWLSPSVMGLLETHVPAGLSVLEYGSGNSTLWWSRRAVRVVAVEHDADFHARLAPRLPGNATSLLAPDTPDGAYEQTPARFGRVFDVVVIDGARRVECAHACLAFLKPQGVVIFDNADRKDVAPGLEHLRRQGFRSMEIPGFCALIAWSNTTAIFYRDGNCLGL